MILCGMTLCVLAGRDLRHVHDAVDAGGPIKRNRAGLQDALERLAHFAGAQRIMSLNAERMIATIDAALADTICREMQAAGVTWPQMKALLSTRYRIDTDRIVTVRDLHDDEAVIVRRHLQETAANKGRTNGKAVAK